MDIKKATIINAAGKYSKIVLLVIINAMLARILSAEDYGIVAIITVFSTFFTTFADMGFGPAIIQNKSLTEDDISDIYSFTVYAAIVLMVAFMAFSLPVAYFYRDRVFIALGQILSLSILFNALNMVPNGILNREKKFVSIAIRTVVIHGGTAVITVILVFWRFRYYALAIQAILVAFFTFIWNYTTTKPRFHLKFKTASIKKVLNYSKYQFAFNIVNYFSRNLDNLLTGKIMGNAELGYYNKAYSLMLYSVNNLTGVISPVLHPVLSDYQNQIILIYRKFMKINKFLACIGIFVASTCFLGAHEIIDIMYGNNWEASVTCFRFLSIAILPQIMNSSAGAIFQTLGDTKLLFLNSCINTSITVIAIIIGVFIGKNIQTLSICIAIAYFCHFISAFLTLIKKGFKYRVTAFIKELLPESFILLVMVGAISIYPFSIINSLLSIFAKCIYLGSIFFAALIVSKEYKLFLLYRK